MPGSEVPQGLLMMTIITGMGTTSITMITVTRRVTAMGMAIITGMITIMCTERTARFAGRRRRISTV